MCVGQAWIEGNLVEVRVAPLGPLHCNGVGWCSVRCTATSHTSRQMSIRRPMILLSPKVESRTKIETDDEMSRCDSLDGSLTAEAVIDVLRDE